MLTRYLTSHAWRTNVWAMAGTPPPKYRATRGTKLRLKRDVYDAAAKAQGATTVVSQVRLTGVPRRTLYNIFGGTAPTLATAMQIADALQVPVSVLFERLEDAA